MGTKSPEALRHLGFLLWHLFRMHNMVAEMGFFIALPSRISASVGDCGNSHHDRLRVIASRQSPSCVVLCAMHSLASKLALWATPVAKTPHRGVFAALTQRAMPVGINREHKAQSPPPQPTQKGHRMVSFALCYIDKTDA